MMCLAEALLRIPDAHTADELIADKLVGTGLGGEARPVRFLVRQRRDFLAAADRQGAGRRAGPLRQLEGGARPRRRPSGRAGRKNRGPRGDEDPRPQLRVRPDDRRSAAARRARALAGPQPQLRHARRSGPDVRRRGALRQSLSRRARPDRQGSEGRFQRSRRAFRSSSRRSTRAIECSHADEAKAVHGADRAANWRRKRARPTST